ncbi:MAG TPA: GFA family protein [Candidatus Eisenbacteria bacterium]|nr:GFA family protein [Candidatus Eisenbacteria bacterium]
MSTVLGSCLCGDVAWKVEEPLDLMSHCHCSRCRKAHGTAFATYVMGRAGGFAFLRGREGVQRYESSPGFFRPFCGRCGSVVPDGELAWEDRVAMPAGPLEGDPGVRPLAHIFVGSKASWFEIRGDIPRFDAEPPGFGMTPLAELPPRSAASGPPRGSCLCGGVEYVVEGAPLRSQHCHCSRCRKARAAAHASNLFTVADGVRFVRGEDLLVSYKVPEARFFTQVFCRVCGSPMPRIDRERGLAVVPLGTLDGDAPMRPQRHIFVGSMAPWYTIADDLPQHAELPPVA